MSKTSMSVIEMGKSLGLGKTESYWLVHKENKDKYQKGVFAQNGCRNAQKSLSGNSGIQGTVRR